MMTCCCCDGKIHERATINTLILDYSTVLSWQHIQSLLFSLGLCFCIFYFFAVCLFAVSLWTFHQTSTGLPLNTPKKTLQGQGRLCTRDERVKCPQKSFLFELVRLCLCHHKFSLVCFLSMTERVSDWWLWDNRERGSDRDEPGYEEDIDSTQANTNHIMHNQQTINLKLDRLVYQVKSWSIPCKTLWKS